MRERSERPSAETTPVVNVDSKPSGIADDYYELTAFESLGIAKRRRRQRHRFVHTQERQIGVGVVADEARA